MTFAATLNPLILSMSKDCPSLFTTVQKKVQCFDRLSTSGSSR